MDIIVKYQHSNLWKKKKKHQKCKRKLGKLILQHLQIQLWHAWHEIWYEWTQLDDDTNEKCDRIFAY